MCELERVLSKSASSGLSLACAYFTGGRRDYRQPRSRVRQRQYALTPESWILPSVVTLDSRRKAPRRGSRDAKALGLKTGLHIRMSADAGHFDI